MGSKRQPTLKESWRSYGESTGDVGRGRGTGTDHANLGGRGMCVNKRGRRGGRNSRGRGRAASHVETIILDDEDEICQQAVGQFELENSDVAKAFAETTVATELPGFDKMAGDIWIYPVNRPVRDYQFNIVQTALFNNTLVSLPTGLGKTFIAAVVMYNFNRWYPNDYVIFMAPTRPLVTQQLEACHNIVGIHPSQTIELTGQTKPNKRDIIWKTKTVFFLTPQVMASDLARGSCPADKVRCIVVDEAHKALGNHAYAQVIAMVSKVNKQFRVLALSATPGSDVAAVQQVFKNLLVSRVELRTENSPDILPYTHQKQIEKVVVPLDDHLNSAHSQVVELFQEYTGRLMKQNCLFGRDGSSFSQFQLLKARELFRESLASRLPSHQKGYIETQFATCISLAHAIELLLLHGLRSFYFFVQAILHNQKGNALVAAELRRHSALQEMLNEVQTRLNISVENSSLNLNTSTLFTTLSNANESGHYVPEEGKETNYILSHPKMKVLKDIVLKHFQTYQTSNETTRIMIFSQYRNSVQEIGSMLNTLRPQVKPMVFIGQAKGGAGGQGLRQKDQVQVVKQFRDGGFNVLVATSVGEEGLDIGEVDLIICFDASKSPTRLVQRMGRTGRQRKGRTIFLLTKGKEERMYSQSISLQTSINKNIVDFSKFQMYLYPFSPRMVPFGVQPQCFKMNIVLTSERSDDGQMLIDNLHSSEDADPDFTKPAPKKRLATKASIKTSKQEHKVNTKKPCSKSTSSSSSSCNMLSLDTYFSSENSSLLPGSSKTSCVPIPELEMEEIQEFLMTDEHPGDPMDLSADFKFMCNILDIQEPSKASTSPCYFVPKFKLRTQDEKAKSQEPMNHFEFHQCLKDIYSQSVCPVKEKCPCGNVYNDLMDFQESDPVIQTKLLAEPVHPHNNEEMKSTFRLPSFVPSPSLNYSESKEASSIIIENDKSGTDITLDLDIGFLLDENDPIFDDDWTGEGGDALDKPEETVNAVETENEIIPLSNRSTEKKSRSDTTHTDDGSSTASNEDFELSITKVTKEVLPCSTKLNPVRNGKRSNKIRRAELRELFKDDLLLFEDDDDSDSTVSNEEFGSPIKRSESDPKITEKSSAANSLPSKCFLDEDVDRFDDTCSTTSDEIFGSPVRQKSNVSTGMEQNPLNEDNFKQSTLTLSKIQNCTPEKANSINIDGSPDIFPSSPDLSQYRYQNRIKRIKLDENQSEISSTLTRMLAPDNNSAELLNRYVEDMRQKNKQESAVITQNQPDKTDKLLITHSVVPDRSFNEMKLNKEVVGISPIVSKKTYKFKKRDSQHSAEAFIIATSLPLLTNDTKQDNQTHNILADSKISNFPPNTSFKERQRPVPMAKEDRLKITQNTQRQNSVENLKMRHLNISKVEKSSLKVSGEAEHKRLKTRETEQTYSKHLEDLNKRTQKQTGFTNRPQNLKKQFETERNRCQSSQSQRLKVNEERFKRLESFAVAENNELQGNSLKTSLMDNSGYSDDDDFVFSKPFPQALKDARKPVLQPTKNSKPVRNPFLEYEAEVTDDSSSADDEDSNNDDLDTFDSSFVSEDSETITDTQQVRYVQSVRDIIHVPRGRIENPLEPKSADTTMNISGNEYEGDSFCVVDDDVEFMEIGTFTQAMNDARDELDREDEHEKPKRQTRYRKKTTGLHVKPEAENSKLFVSSKELSSKTRRRIISFSDSSDDD